MTETRDIKLSSDRWTEAGSGPMLIGAHGDHVLFAVSDAAPCGDVGFLQRFDAPPTVLTTTSRIWARATLGGRYGRAVVAALSDKKFR